MAPEKGLKHPISGEFFDLVDEIWKMRDEKLNKNGMELQ